MTAHIFTYPEPEESSPSLPAVFLLYPREYYTTPTPRTYKWSLCSTYAFLFTIVLAKIPVPYCVPFTERTQRDQINGLIRMWT